MKQVLSVGQIKHLQKIGIELRNTSMLLWHPQILDGIPNSVWDLSFWSESLFSEDNVYPAYTLQDILGKLPKYINDFGTKHKLHIEPTFAGPWCISYQIGICEPFVFKIAEDPLDAAYEMLCWCIENGYVKVEKEE
jgi:hypothetical protein